MDIYNLVPSHRGKRPGDEFLATVELVDDGVRVECYDSQLRKKLKQIFSTPIVKRIPGEKESGVFTHRNEVVQPFTPEFFEEIIYSLYKQNLYGVIQK